VGEKAFVAEKKQEGVLAVPFLGEGKKYVDWKRKTASGKKGKAEESCP